MKKAATLVVDRVYIWDEILPSYMGIIPINQSGFNGMSTGFGSRGSVEIHRKNYK